MDTLDRYLVKEYLLLFIVLLFGLSSVFLGIDFFSNVWKLRIPTDQIFWFYFYKAPAAFQTFMPVACLMASLLVLSNMSKQNEILALYTGGISRLRIASTLIALVSLLCTLGFLTFDTLTPIFAKKEIMIREGVSKENAATFSPTRFWYRSGSLIYNVGYFDPVKAQMNDVNIYSLGPNFHIKKRIWGKQADFSKSTGWVILEGFEIDYQNQGGYPQAKQFSDRKGEIPEGPEEFRSFRVWQNAMPLRDLRKYIQRSKSYGLDTTVTQVHYHERMASVFTPLIFVLLAIPLATKPLRSHSTAKSVGYCFLIVFLYLLIFRLTTSVGRSAHIPAAVAGWTANGIFLVYALFALLRR